MEFTTTANTSIPLAEREFLDDRPRNATNLPPVIFTTAMMGLLAYGVMKLEIKHLVPQDHPAGELGWMASVWMDGTQPDPHMIYLAGWDTDNHEHMQVHMNDEGTPFVVSGVEAVTANDIIARLAPSPLHNRPIHQQLVAALTAAVSRGWDATLTRELNEHGELASENLTYTNGPRWWQSGNTAHGELHADEHLQLRSGFCDVEGNTSMSPGRELTVNILSGPAAPYTRPVAAMTLE